MDSSIEEDCQMRVTIIALLAAVFFCQSAAIVSAEPPPEVNSVSVPFGSVTDLEGFKVTRVNIEGRSYDELVVPAQRGVVRSIQVESLFLLDSIESSDFDSLTMQLDSVESNTEEAYLFIKLNIGNRTYSLRAIVSASPWSIDKSGNFKILTAIGPLETYYICRTFNVSNVKCARISVNEK
jgi:hypothetical protein